MLCSQYALKMRKQIEFRQRSVEWQQVGLFDYALADAPGCGKMVVYKGQQRFDMLVLRVAKQADNFQFAPTGFGQFAPDSLRNARETLQGVLDFAGDGIPNGHVSSCGFRCRWLGLSPAPASVTQARRGGLFVNAFFP